MFDLGGSGNSSRYVVAVLVVGVSVVASLMLNWIFKVVFVRIVGQTKTKVDDALITLLRKPVFWSVMLAGIYLSSLPLELNERVFEAVRNGLVTIALALWGSSGVKIARLLLREIKKRDKLGKENLAGLLPFLDSLVTLVVWAIVVLTGLSLWGINITPALASAGVAGVAVAFAAKDTVANIFGGLSVFFDKPYKIGDYVLFDDRYRGEVIDIGVRSTKIRTRDNVLLTVPNSVLVTGAVVNETGLNPHLRIRIPLGVAYGTDLAKAEKILLEVMKNDKQVLDKPQTPRVRYRKFGDSAIELEVLGMIKRPAHRGRVVHELIKQIDKRMRTEKIEIPYPQRDVRLRKV